MRRLLAALAVVFGAGVAVAGTFSGGFTFGDGGGLAGIGLGDGTTLASGTVVPGASFDLVAGATTPNDLSDALTVNSTAMTLVLACDAQGVSGTSWACRDASGVVTLVEGGSGTSPSTTIASPFHAHDSLERQVTYALSQKRHQASATTVADVADDDLVFEVVGKVAASSGATIMDKGLAGTDGWRFNQNATNGLQLSLRTGSTTTTVNGPTVSTTWHHSIAFVDRNEVSTNGAIVYTNGAAGAGVDVSARSTTLTNATALAIGAPSSASAANPATVVTLHIWKCTACMAGGATNPAQWSVIARQRAATAFGVAPLIASGVAAPTALTRATTAHVDVVDGVTRSLYLVGAGAPRVARRTYSGGTVVAGYMSEPAVSNIALQSQTLGTTWAAITVGDNVLADQWAGADLTTTGDDVDGNNSLGEHGLRQSITLTAATYTLSAWAKAGAQTFVALRDNTIVNGAAWFNLATCTSASCTIGEDCAAAVGTVQAGVIQARAQRWPIDTTGDGVADVSLCRMSIAYTGTAVAHDHDLLCAPSDGVTSYTDADATADCGFWGVRVEAFPTMTSYLATTTAAVARNADDVRFDGASHYTGDPSTMDVQVLCPNFDTAIAQTFASIGASNTDFARLVVDVTNDRPRTTATVTTTQWDISGTSGDVSDAVAHSLRVTMATNDIAGYYDGGSFGTDTLANVPTAAGSFFWLGSAAGTATGQTACLISRARLWPAIVTPAVSP